MISPLLFSPAFALLNPFAVITLFLIVGKLVEQAAGERTALPAVLMFFRFTAGFYRTGLSPEGPVNMYTAFTAHLLFKFALTA